MIYSFNLAGFDNSNSDQVGKFLKACASAKFI